jgi:phage terminase small subunit
VPRKSSASLNVVPLESRGRLRPPPNLPQAEKELFAQLVASCPAQHFRLSDLPLLCRYCEASVLAEQAAGHLRAEGPVIAGRLSPWVTVQEKAIRALTALSMRLRLSPQARAPKNDRPGARKEPEPSAYDLMRLSDDREDQDLGG